MMRQGDDFIGADLIMHDVCLLSPTRCTYPKHLRGQGRLHAMMIMESGATVGCRIGDMGCGVAEARLTEHYVDP